jgi:hypothetical protein
MTVRTIGGCVAVAALFAGIAAGSDSSVSARTSAVPVQPGSLALGPDGSLYISDDRRDQILARLPSGRFKVIAGSGRRGFAGEGGRAVAAELNDPGGMAVAADGSLYFADSGNNRVRKVSLRGIISTVAGNGKQGWTAGGSPARAAPILSPAAVAFGQNGRLYIAAAGWGEVLRLDAGGTLTRLAGTRRFAGVYGINRPAIVASADGVNGLALDKAGNLYLAGLNTKTLLMIDRGGRMRLPAGLSSFYPRGAGGLTTTSTGRVLAIQTQDIVALTARGPKTIHSFAGRKISGIIGFLPAGIAVSSRGLIYTDTSYGNGWSDGSAIITITHSGHTRVLWRSPQ